MSHSLDYFCIAVNVCLHKPSDAKVVRSLYFKTQMVRMKLAGIIDFRKFKAAEQALLASDNIEFACQQLVDECEKVGNQIIKYETLLLRATYFILSKQNSRALPDLGAIISDDHVDPRVSFRTRLNQ